MINLVVRLVKQIIRKIARVNLVPYRQNIMEERIRLVHKKYDNPSARLSKEDQARCDYLDKCLDLIEDSLYGEDLDRLEYHVKKHQGLARKIHKAVTSIRRFIA